MLPSSLFARYIIWQTLNDPGDIAPYAAFHLGLHFFLRHTIFREKIQYCVELITCEPSIYAMDHPKLIVYKGLKGLRAPGCKLKQVGTTTDAWKHIIQSNLYKTDTPAKIDKTKILMTHGRLMKVESISECSPWSILQYFQTTLSDNWS